jgi:hypothetical protein
MSYAVASLQPIRDQIAREVGINAGWVDVTGQRSIDTQYENTTGRTYEVSIAVANLNVRLRSSDGAVADLFGDIDSNIIIGRLAVCFHLQPGESVEALNYGVSFSSIGRWFERQM